MNFPRIVCIFFQGDYGGPLVCKGYLIGIATDSFGCGKVNNPSIFLKIPSYSTWIKRNHAGVFDPSLYLNVSAAVLIICSAYFQQILHKMLI